MLNRVKKLTVALVFCLSMVLGILPALEPPAAEAASVNILNQSHFDSVGNDGYGTLALDGNPSTYWESTAWVDHLQISLDQEYLIDKFRVVHYGADGDPLNTADFTLFIWRADLGGDWYEIETVTGNTANVTEIAITIPDGPNGRVGQYFQLKITKANSSSSDPGTIRIVSFELYSEQAPSTTPVTGVTLNKATTSIAEGSTETLVATVTPSNATDKSVTWSSDNHAAATVDSSGVVTAVAEGVGTATIKATTDDGGFTASCVVSVTPPSASVNILDQSHFHSTKDTNNAGVPDNSEAKLALDGNPNTYWERAVTISDPMDHLQIDLGQEYLIERCRVVHYGEISGNPLHNTADFTLFVWRADLGGDWYEIATFTGNTNNVTDITISLPNNNDAQHFLLRITKANSLATPDAIRIVSFELYGPAGPPEPVTGVSLNKVTTSIPEGSSETLVATVAPSNATNKKVEWTSSNTSAATVNSNGVVTAVAEGAGTATITATTADGGYFATCVVTVTAPTPTPPPPPVLGMRGRVQVVNNTIVTDQGTLLRAGPVTVCSMYFGGDWMDWQKDPNTARRFRDSGYNTVRVNVMDMIPGYGDSNSTIAKVLPFLKELVDVYTAAGMYVVINYHDTGGGSRINGGGTGGWSAPTFWTQVAPVYKDYTNVLFELVNEPWWWPDQYTPTGLQQLANVYKTARDLAPDTHMIHLSYACVGDQPETVTTADLLVQEINLLSINGVTGANNFDLTKNSMGFHTYNTGNSGQIQALKAKYPVVCTEWDSPHRDMGGNWYNITSVNGTTFVGQALEALGISWFDWSFSGQDSNQFIRHFDGFFPDARAKDYIWLRDDFGAPVNIAPSAHKITESHYDFNTIYPEHYENVASLPYHNGGNNYTPNHKIDFSGYMAADTYVGPLVPYIGGADWYGVYDVSPNGYGDDPAFDRKWRSTTTGDRWLQFDLGEEYELSQWVVFHEGAHAGRDRQLNTSDFRLEVSPDGLGNWTAVDTVIGNTMDITNRTIATTARHVRLYITKPTQTANEQVNIWEIELHGQRPTPPSSSITKIIITRE